MVILDIVLRNFTFVLLLLFGQKIDREPLLQERIALVLLIGQDAPDGRLIPDVFSGRCLDAPSGQLVRNGMRRHALKEQAEDEPHGLRLLRIDDHLAVGSFVVAEEVTVGKTDLSVSKSFPVSPCHVFGDGTSLLLRQ